MDEGEKDCLLCSKEFPCEKHQKKIENDSRKQEIYTHSVDGLKSHLPTHYELIHECPTCHKIFSNRIFLKHLKTHIGLRDFKCNICSMGFYEKYSLITHMKKHSQVKEFKCNICDREFFCRSSMYRHLKIHKEGRNMKEEFECPICRNVFPNKGSFRMHMETHLECKEFKCHHCSKEFLKKPQLMKHVRKVHSSKNEFKCGLCSKDFMHSWALMKHMAVHSKLVLNAKSVPHGKQMEFRCHHCGQEYTKEFHLEQHFKSHCDQMIIDSNSSTFTNEEDVITTESEPEEDPLAIEDEIPHVVKKECPDLTLLDETPSVFICEDFIGNEFPVKLESNLEVFEKNSCTSGDVKHEIVKDKV